jgi:hypothetical protein
MNRLLMLVALLFGFAAVSGASASFASGGSAAHLGVTAVVLADVCAEGDGAAKVAIYKPCTKKLNGVLIPCPHPPQVLPVAVTCAVPVAELMPVPLPPSEMWIDRSGERQFRPPRA